MKVQSNNSPSNRTTTNVAQQSPARARSTPNGPGSEFQIKDTFVSTGSHDHTNGTGHRNMNGTSYQGHHRYGGNGTVKASQLKEAHRRQQIPEADQKLFSEIDQYDKQLKALGPNPKAEDIQKLQKSLPPEVLQRVQTLEKLAMRRADIRKLARRMSKDPKTAAVTAKKIWNDVLATLPENERELFNKIHSENKARTRNRSEGIYPFNQTLIIEPTRPRGHQPKRSSRSRSALKALKKALVVTTKIAFPSTNLILK